jgi:hypothetical protein
MHGRCHLFEQQHIALSRLSLIAIATFILSSSVWFEIWSRIVDALLPCQLPLEPCTSQRHGTIAYGSNP